MKGIWNYGVQTPSRYVRNIYFGNSSGKPRLIPDLSEFLCGLPAKKKLRWKSRLPSCHLLNHPFFGPCQHSLALNELAASSGALDISTESVFEKVVIYTGFALCLFLGSSKCSSGSVLGIFKGDVRGVPRYVKSYFILFRMFGLDSGNLTR